MFVYLSNEMKMGWDENEGEREKRSFADQNDSSKWRLVKNDDDDDDYWTFLSQSSNKNIF